MKQNLVQYVTTGWEIRKLLITTQVLFVVQIRIMKQQNGNGSGESSGFIKASFLNPLD
jgi:hypothetical protein